jgi:hypothetical protein
MNLQFNKLLCYVNCFKTKKKCLDIICPRILDFIQRLKSGRLARTYNLQLKAEKSGIIFLQPLPQVKTKATTRLLECAPPSVWPDKVEKKVAQKVAQRIFCQN